MAPRRTPIHLPALTRAEKSTASDHRYLVAPRGMSPRAAAEWVRRVRAESGTRVPVRRGIVGEP